MRSYLARSPGPLLLLALVSLCGPACKRLAPAPPPPLAGIKVALPGAEQGTGFDDLRYAAGLRKILVPGGRTGALFFLDPKTRALTSASGFSKADGFRGGHGAGPTSAEEGRGLVYVIDRGTRALSVVDPAAAKLVVTTPLQGDPDFVRFVEATSEVWVTEPAQRHIEVLALHKGPKGDAPPVHKELIATPGGCEGLEIDAQRGRAYTQMRGNQVLAIDLRTRAPVGRWPNECGGSRSLALDEKRGFLFAACTDGAATLDVGHGGQVLSRTSRGKGLDVISYSPKLRHLYLAAGKSRELIILGVSASGQLIELGSLPIGRDSHCVTSDDEGQAYVCSPWEGAIRVVPDPYPPGAAGYP